MDWPEFVQNQAEDVSARQMAAGAGWPRPWGDGQGGALVKRVSAPKQEATGSSERCRRP